MQSPEWDDLSNAQIDKFKAEAEAFRSEARYNGLQSDRLLRAEADERSTLNNQRIYDFVSEVNEVSVHHCLSRLTEWRNKSKDPIMIRFNTGGGDLISGMALYDYIRGLVDEGIEVTTVAMGMAASMGAVLVQAGSRRYVTPGVWMMIHEVSSFSEGKLSEIEDETRWLTRAQDAILDILAERSTYTKAEIKRKWKVSNGYWMTAQEAVEYGFADAIATPASLYGKKAKR